MIAVAAMAGFFIVRGLIDGAGDAISAVNPVSRDNIFYRGVNAVGAVLSGDEGFTLGGAIYDAAHGDEIGRATNGIN